MSNFKFEAMSIKGAKVRKLLIDFLDEMRSDVKNAGNKRTIDKSLVK